VTIVTGASGFAGAILGSRLGWLCLYVGVATDDDYRCDREIFACWRVIELSDDSFPLTMGLETICALYWIIAVTY
jgi:hypothetical protein